jgi:spore coat polysaccharide biosynthesis protein SpsF
MSGDLTLAAAMRRPRRVVTIIQARMTSTRLPGKVLAEAMGRPMMAYQIERLRRVRLHDFIAVATTTNSDDEPIVALAYQMDCAVYRGSEHNVIERYIGAAETFGADIIHRIGADDPFCDPAIVDASIALLIAGRYDRVQGDGWPLGLNPEVFTRGALYRTADSTDPDEIEHLGPYWERRPREFRLGRLPAPTDQYHRRVTLDTPEDLEFHRRVLADLYPANPDFDAHDLLAYLDAHPEVEAINRDVKQYQWDRTPIDGGAPEILRKWS